MKQLSAILLGAAAVLSAFPGLSIALDELGAPPGRRGLYAGLLIAVGVLALLITWSYRQRIQRLRAGVVASRSTCLVVLSFVSAFAYATLLQTLVLHHEQQFPGDPAPVSVELFFPLASAPPLATMIELAGGYEEAIARYDLPVIQAELRRQGVRLLVTDCALLLLLTIFEVGLVVALSTAGWRALTPPRSTR